MNEESKTPKTNACAKFCATNLIGKTNEETFHLWYGAMIDQSASIEAELNSALSQLTEAESRLAEKEKEIAMLRDVVEKSYAYLSERNLGEPAKILSDGIHRVLMEVEPKPYIHTDKVKTLVESLHQPPRAMRSRRSLSRHHY